MNKDVRLCVSFLTNRKRRKLQKKLGAEGVLAFVDLLLSTAMSRPKGILSGMDNEDIALDAQWTGNANEFVQTLVDVGFLDEDNGVYSLHDWGNHNPFAAHADERSKRAKKAAEARWGRKDKNADSMPDACKEDATSMQDASLSNAPSPSPTPTPIVNNADSSESASLSSKREYRAKSGKKLTGKRLEIFEQFWDAFNLKQGKAAAADEWLKIPHLTDQLMKQIISAAEIEASRRPALIEGGGSPKWAQGWLASRRFEDELYQTSVTPTASHSKSDEEQIKEWLI